MILAFGAWWGLVAAVGAAVSYGVLALAASRLSSNTLRTVLFTAWLFHAVALAAGLLGEPPQFGFAPALSMTVWLVLTVYAIESRLFPQMQAHWALAGLGSAAVVLAAIFPGTTYHRVASPWLPLHWALGIASYGLFAAAVVHGWLMTRSEKSIRQTAQNNAGVPLMTLERLTFRFVEAGFVLLSATLFVGWLFAEQLYGPGRAWAGVGARRCVCCTLARACCCWVMRARDLYLKWCYTAHEIPAHPRHRDGRTVAAQEQAPAGPR